MSISPLRTFAARIGYCVTCVLPADVLSADPTDEHDPSHLRAAASRDQVSYLQVLRMQEEGLYLARVAATPEQVARGGYTILLSEEELFFALPWDERLHGKSSKHLLTLMRAHAAHVCPLSPSSPSMLSGSPDRLTPLDTVEVSEDVVLQVIQQAAQRGKEHLRQRVFHFQQGLLRAMIDALMQQLYQGQDEVSARTLQVRCGLLAQLQRWQRHTHKRIVRAESHFSEKQQQVIWRLTVGLPAGVAVAA